MSCKYCYHARKSKNEGLVGCISDEDTTTANTGEEVYMGWYYANVKPMQSCTENTPSQGLLNYGLIVDQDSSCEFFITV